MAADLARLLAPVLACIGLSQAAATPLTWDLKLNQPPIIQDSAKPHPCTITWLIEDIATNDAYAARMQVTPAEDAQPVGNRMPCPATIPPRMAARALEACTARAADEHSCVYADMSRGFEREPDLRNTAENASRCQSDHASHIGIACWQSGTLDVCDVGCGATPEAATSAALGRCADKHQHACTAAGSVPVLVP